VLEDAENIRATAETCTRRRCARRSIAWWRRGRVYVFGTRGSYGLATILTLASA